MSRDERKRQKALLRKKRRREERSGTAGRILIFPGAGPGLTLGGYASQKALLLSARDFPIHECLVRPDLEEQGLSPFLISRRQPDGSLVFASFMVDTFCLGVKDAFWNVDVPLRTYERDLRQSVTSALAAKAISPLLFHQLLYGAVDYAASIGFEPHRDYALASRALEPRASIPPNPELRFGKDGKPLYVSGPGDDVTRVIRTLERRVGSGNFDFIAGGPMMS